VALSARTQSGADPVIRGTSGRVLVYLHGFASGPSSKKACSVREQFEARGARLEVPDLTPGPTGFEGSSPLSMLGVVQGLLGTSPGPHGLIGSSLGGYLSALQASRDPRIDRLVLLAPAFNLFERWNARLTGEQLTDWRERGLEVDHYVSNGKRLLGWQFHQGAAGLPPFPEVKVPALVIAGRRDQSIPLEDIEAWVAGTPSARLIVVDDGHELAGSLALIRREAWDFLRPLA
jgi:pimeloyl-ACP methyl ester carboxylesterase